jgi:hypothetical protein
MIGIENSLQLIESLKVLAMDLIEIVKSIIANPKNIAAYFKFVKVGSELYTVVKQAIASMPELKDLDSNESGTLATAFYEAAAEVVAAATGK